MSPRYILTCWTLLVLLGTPATLSQLSWFGTLSPLYVSPSGVVTDRFSLVGDFYGLAYFGGDKDYGATQFYTIRHDAGSGVDFFDTITGTTSTVADRFDCSTTAATTNMFTLTFSAPDLTYGSTIFYYMRTKVGPNGTETPVFGTLIPGAIYVGAEADLIVTNLTGNFDALTFAAANVGHGANLFYFLRHDSVTCLSHFGVLDPGTLTWYDSFELAPNFDTLYFTELDMGYGANMFYYLRHDIYNTSTFGVIDPINKTFTDQYVLGKNFNELAFTATDISWGPNLFYYIRGQEFTCIIPSPSTSGATTANRGVDIIGIVFLTTLQLMMCCAWA